MTEKKIKYNCVCCGKSAVLVADKDGFETLCKKCSKPDIFEATYSKQPAVSLERHQKACDRIDYLDKREIELEQHLAEKDKIIKEKEEQIAELESRQEEALKIVEKVFENVKKIAVGMQQFGSEVEKSGMQ